MNNPSLYAGCDISADTLDVVRQCGDRPVEYARFPNDADGHAALCQWLTAPGLPARLVIEASASMGSISPWHSMRRTASR